MMIAKAIKPPIGLIPRKIWQEQVIEARLDEVGTAINRYVSAGHQPPKEWIKEFRKLLKQFGRLGLNYSGKLLVEL